MEASFLARIQFAMTVGFHYIFPPITIGISWLIFWLMNQYKKTRDEKIGSYAKFWIKLFAITFSVGVASGITMEFQFGTNWAGYSKFVGDIFGAPLAAEAVLAFFLESTFMGVLIFGWNRFSVKTLRNASFLVATGSTLSAFWIIVANSWMQTPAGYKIVDGRAELTSFFDAVFNPSTLPRFFHAVDGALITGAFFMMGISAWYILKGRDLQFAKKSFKLALVVGFISAITQLFIGHWSAIQVAETQPEKLAAYEAHYDTQKEAPMNLFGIPDDKGEKLDAAIKVPYLLSLMVGLDPQTEVKGLKDFPRDERPPVTIVFVTFRIMVALGLFFIALTMLGLFLWRKDKLFENKLFMKVVFFSLPLPTIANELGWMAAEIGRQPWIVYRVPGMRTDEAASITVSAGEILFSIIIFAIIYTILGFLWFYLLRKAVHQGPQPLAADAPSEAGMHMDSNDEAPKDLNEESREVPK
ncbi:MAG: cytochrome ubiquinol oxidase subunit I [Deltaproteobacteria bacterium]|nr:cytochrome ubiquinol oxidase subunit I [Deltaproteobacteria bacterium]